MIPASFTVFYADGQLRAEWDASSVPEGFSVALEFLDSNGVPLAAQPQVTYSPGNAVVSGTPSAGSKFSVRAHVESPFTPAQNVTIHAVGAVTNPLLDWHLGALHARWTSPAGDGPFQYRVVLLDFDGHPLNPQPQAEAESATGVAFAGSAVDDLTVYKVSVQAEQEGSLGPVAVSPPYTIDKKLPDGLLLRELLERLRRAEFSGTRAFALTADLVREERITRLFPLLLEQPNGVLPLSETRISSTAASVQVDATVTASFANARPATLTFTEADGRLELSMAIRKLGSFSVNDLITARILPRSAYNAATWSANLPSFPELEATLDSRLGALSFSGPPTATPWSIGIGLADVQIGAVTPAIQFLAPDDENAFRRFEPLVQTEMQLGQQTRIPVRVQLPSGLTGWLITLGDPGAATLGDLAKLDPLMAGANSGLPAAVIAFGGFRLTQLRFGFPPSPKSWNLNAIVQAAPTAPWDPLGDGTIVIREIAAQINLVLLRAGDAIEAESSGSLRGKFAIKDSLTIDVFVSGPDVDGAWTLTGGAAIENFSLGDLARFLGGGASPLSDALARLGTIGSLSLNEITLRFGLAGEAAGLHFMRVEFEAASWTIPSLPWFSIDQIALGFEVDNPAQSTRTVEGWVTGSFTLGYVSVAVEVEFSPGDTWNLQLAAFAAELSGLDAIGNILPASTIVPFLPAGLDSSTTLGLGGFTMTYNAAESFIAESTFDLEVNAGWTWLSGQLTLWSIELHLKAKRASKDAAFDLTGSISGTVELGGAVFGLRAVKQASGDPWSFRGGLAEEYTLDFNGVLEQLNTGLTLPSGYGLPTSITLVVADLTYVPATGKLDFFSQSTLDWSFDFGQAKLTIDALGGELHIAAGTGAKSGAVNGNFSLGGVKGLAVINLGAAETLIQVLIGTDVVAGAADLLNAVAGAGAYERIDAPSGFARPAAFTRASLTVNLTKSSLLLTGEYSGGDAGFYGGVALLVAKKTTDDWGYVLAGVLSSWTYEKISPVLGGARQVLGPAGGDAAIALSLLDEQAGEDIVKAIPAIGSNLAILPGLNFFVRLSFSAGWLANLAQIISLAGPYTLAGNIPSDTAKPVMLTAMLGSLRLLDTFAFEQIVLNYTRTPASNQAQATNVLRLTGNILARLDKEYCFRGDLRITADNASFRAATANSVSNPLGIPGITLDGLGFEFSAEFANGQRTRAVTTFYGQVSFAGGPTLAAVVGMENGAAVLVLVKLGNAGNQPAELSISALFRQVTGLDWPNALDVKLSNGQLWYVPGANALTYQGQAYAAGFHAAADVNIFFLPTVRLALEIAGEGQTKRLSASAQFATPVDWSFIRFVGTRDHGGPATGPIAAIDTQNRALPFSLASTVVLLESEIGNVTIQVGTEMMTGALTLPESAGIFAGESIAFEWDEHGFRVNNWPLRNLALPKFDLENISGGATCGQIILDLLPIDSKFNLDVNLSIEPPSLNAAAMLNIALNGTFDLVVTSSAYRNDPLLRANIVNATARIPFPSSDGYNWSRLRDSFVDTIKQAGESIIQNLLGDAKNVAKLAAVAGAKWTIAAAIEYLVCRGMTSEAAEAAVYLAASAEGGTATVCGGATVEAGGVVAAIVGGVVTNETGIPDRKKPKPRRPAALSLQFDVDTLRIAWAATDAANTTSYAIALADHSGKRVPVSAVTGTQSTVPLSVLTLGLTYIARIIADGPGGQSDPSEPASLALLTAPAVPTLSFDDPTMTAAWTAVAGAESYVLKVLDGSGSPVPDPQITLSERQATVQAQAFEAGGTFSVQLQANAPSVKGPWSEPATIAIELLSAPESLAAATVGGVVSVTWRQVRGATGYAGSLTDAAGQPVNASITIQGNSGIVSGAAIADGARVLLTVKATAPNAVGQFSAPLSIVVNVIPVPEISGHLYDVPSHRLRVMYSPIAKASSIDFKVSDSQGGPIVPAQIDYGTGQANLTFTELADGAYTLQARAVAGDDMSEWSAPSPFEIMGLASPANVTVDVQFYNVVASWNAVANATSYRAQVLDSGRQPLDPQPPMVVADRSVSIDARRVQQGTYFLQVRAGTAFIEGPYSDPVPFAWSPAMIWQTPGHDFNRSGRGRLTGPATPSERWSIGNLNFSSGSPTVASDGTIVAPAGNFVAAFGPDSSEHWRWSDTPKTTCSSASIGDDGSVYFGSTDNNVYALDKTGMLRWKYTTGGAVSQAPAIAGDGTIYAGSGDAKIYALAPDGTLKWTFSGADAAKDAFDSEIALGPDNTIYAGTAAGNIYAITPDGSLKWRYAASNRISVGPAIGADGTNYMAVSSSEFFAIRPDGSEKWHNALSSDSNLAFSRAAVAGDGTIYVHYSDDSLYAFAPDGTQEWKAVLGVLNSNPLQCPPSIDSRGAIYVGTESGVLYAIGKDGAESWKIETGVPIRSSIAIGPGSSLYLSSNAQLRAYGTIRISGVSARSSIALPLTAFGVAAAGNYLYVTDVNAGVRAYDVTDRVTPSKLLQTAPDSNYRAAILGNYLYVAAIVGKPLQTGLRIYDISKMPEALTKVGEARGPAAKPEGPRGIAVTPTVAFVAGGRTGVSAYDIADPTQPRWSNTIAVKQGDGSHGVAVRDNLLYVGNSQSGLQVYRIDSPQSQPHLGGDTSNFPYGDITDIAPFDGHYLLLLSFISANAHIYIIDVRDPAAPVQVSSLRLPAPALGIAMMGHYAVTTGGGTAAYLADLRDPAKPLQVGGFLIGSGVGYQIARLGTYLYVPMGGDLRVLQLQVQELA